MQRISVRVDDALYRRLQRRSYGANLTLSEFVRQVLGEAADPDGRYIYSAQDELLATEIQTLTLVATAIGAHSPELLQQGMADARVILGERGLLGPEQET